MGRLQHPSDYVLSLQVTNCLLLATYISLRVALMYFVVVNWLTITVNPLIKPLSRIHYGLVADQQLQIIAMSCNNFHGWLTKVV